MINNLFFNLIVAHILGDFYLQWGSSCKNKVLYSVKGKDLWLHSLVIGILSWCAIWDFRGWWLAACIMVLHFLIDWAKSYIQVKWDIFKIENPKQYNPQIEMFAHFKTKSSFHKTKGII